MSWRGPTPYDLYVCVYELMGTCGALLCLYSGSTKRGEFLAHCTCRLGTLCLAAAEPASGD